MATIRQISFYRLYEKTVKSAMKHLNLIKKCFFDLIGLKIKKNTLITENNILIWDRHKVIKENGKVTFRTYIDTGGDYNEYDITLYRLSPETFLYLRGKHMTMSEFPSIGMSTPAFTYSNVAGGIGIVGSWWGTEMILKYTE